MRENLEKIEEFTGTFIGFYTRTRTLYRYNRPTEILINYIKNEDNNIIAKFSWIEYVTEFKELGKLKSGALIQFDGKVTVYQSITTRSSKSYEFSDFSNVKLI